MPSFVSPGVYPIEKDFSLYVPNLSTTIGGMVGTAQKGPLNEATLVTSALQFIQTFGEPDPSMFGPYAALQFLQEGSQLYYVRVAGPAAAQALYLLPSSEDGTGDTAANAVSISGPFAIVLSTSDTLVITELSWVSGAEVETPRTVTLTAGGTQSVSNVVSDITGTSGYSGWGFTAANVGGVVKVVSKTKSSQIGFQISGNANTVLLFSADEKYGIDSLTLPATIIGSATAPFNISGSDDTLTIHEVDYRTGVPVTTARVVTLTHSGTQTIDQVVDDINTASESGPWAILASNSGGALILSTPGLETDLFGIQVVGSAAANELGLDTSYIHKGAKAKWLVQAVSPGAWGNAISVTLAAGSLSGFKLTVKVDGIAVETFNNLSATPSDAAYVETLINGVSAYITVTDNQSIGGPPTLVTDEPLTLGNDDLSGVSDSSYIGVDSPPTGMQVFANPETIDINLLLVPGVSSAAVVNAGINLVTTRADAFYIVDPPFGLSAQNVIKWHNGAAPYDDHQSFDSSYAALYWPWLQVFDPVNNVKVWTPPSGNVARAYAFTDRTSETWFAPAGVNRGHLVTPLQVEHSATKGERDALYGDGNAINPIIMIPQFGITIWGERTLQRAPTSLDRVNVRRMMLFLEKSVARTARVLVFEPNDPILWSQFKDLVTPFCLSIQSRRGMVDFAVICDKTTNTPDAVDRNEMHGTLLIKPTKTAEFIAITFALTAQGATFSELVGF